MKLSQVKSFLESADAVAFKLPNGNYVPEHFHVTEVGKITKHFIDCGGIVRQENVVNFQLLDANDYDHRLKPGKLLKIISLSETVLQLEDLDIEVEYQNQTIGKYALDFDGKDFLLVTKQTACLASDGCGTTITRSALALETTDKPSCAPGGGCC